jgi:hypothetical protein
MGSSDRDAEVDVNRTMKTPIEPDVISALFGSLSAKPKLQGTRTDVANVFTGNPFQVVI